MSWEVNPSLLLSGNIPVPMYGLSPRTVLGTNWWDRTRRMVYKSTDFHCNACGTHKEKAKYHKWLEAHELYEIDYKKGQMVFTKAIPLCHFCHSYVHDGRLDWLLRTRKISHGKYVQIIQHGDDILQKAKLSKPTLKERIAWAIKMQDEGGFAAWEDWRLIIDGKKYPPIITQQQWLKDKVME